MNNNEVAKVWKHLKALHELVHRQGISIEALQRTLDEQPGLQERRLYHEVQASQDYAQGHAAMLRLIDDTIQRLKDAEVSNE